MAEWWFECALTHPSGEIIEHIVLIKGKKGRQEPSVVKVCCLSNNAKQGADLSAYITLANNCKLLPAVNELHSVCVWFMSWWVTEGRGKQSGPLYIQIDLNYLWTSQRAEHSWRRSKSNTATAGLTVTFVLSVLLWANVSYQLTDKRGVSARTANTQLAVGRSDRLD